MIRTNLSTRPFYNERAVHLVLVLVAAVALGATAINVVRVLQLSRRDTQLAVQASRDEARAAELRTAAARLRSSVTAAAIERASQEAGQANDLIDRRTFSWTELFNRFETTLPEEVRITSVRPHVEAGRGIVLSITVVAQGSEDVNQFIENLEATGAFAGLLARDERLDDQGQTEAALESVYRPDVGRVGGAARP